MNREMLIESVRAYGLRADFPIEATRELCCQAENLPDKALSFLNDLAKEYEEKTKLTYDHQMAFEKLADPVHCYTAQMLFYMAFLAILEKKYRQKNLPIRYFERVLFDLRAKLLECQAVYGIWGSFVAIWFARFFNFTLYGIGRLEFAPFHMEYDYEGQGVKLSKGDFAIDVHIPSGAPLPHEEVLSSYEEAKAFFGCSVFVCESWLLWPENKTLFRDCPNLTAFFEDYDVVQSQTDHGDLWRIFGKDHENSPEKLPRDSKLRLAYAKHLTKGLPVGWGKGVFVFK